jgi:anaerobic dimethyl sulfoxide reductase subunit B (iron-sulfur subunit)
MDQQTKQAIKDAVAKKKREHYTPVVPDVQFGFIHNNVDCIG